MSEGRQREGPPRDGVAADGESCCIDEDHGPGGGGYVASVLQVEVGLPNHTLVWNPLRGILPRLMFPNGISFLQLASLSDAQPTILHSGQQVQE